MVKIHEGHFVNWSAMELLIMVFTCASIIFLQMGLMVIVLFFMTVEHCKPYCSVTIGAVERKIFSETCILIIKL